MSKFLKVTQEPDGEHLLLHWRMTDRMAEQLMVLIARVNAFAGEDDWTYKLYCALDDLAVNRFRYTLIHDGEEAVTNLLNFEER